MLNGEFETDTIPNWMPSNIADYKGQRVQIKLLCGADYLESMATSPAWTTAEVINYNQDILMNELK